MKRSTALFSTCGECESDHPNHSGICPTCEIKHGYANDNRERPFVDDVQPDQREAAGRG